MPTALITGIGGFTGGYLSSALQQKGYTIVGLTQNKHFPEQGLYACDLLDRSALEETIAQIQPDVVAHLAAISFVAHGDADEIYRTNVVGTRNLLQALDSCEKRPGSVLLASSANVYGNTTIDPIDEEVLPQPANDYAVSKLAMEYMARLWFDRLPITIVRPFNYTGVGQANNFLLPKIIDHFKRGQRDIELGNLDVERDFTDVRIVAEAYARLLSLAPAGEIYNICSGVATSLKSVIGMAETIAGYAINVKVNPAFVRANEIHRLRGSNRKLLDMVGELPNIPLEQTLQWMYDS